MQAMQAQNMMWAPAFATAVSSVANVGINVLLIRWYGFDGAAAAFSVTRVLLFLLLAGEATLWHHRNVPSMCSSWSIGTAPRMTTNWAYSRSQTPLSQSNASLIC